MANFAQLVEMIKQREYWDPFKGVWNNPNWAIGNGPWKMVQEKEFQKIACMSTAQLFDYINFVIQTPIYKIEGEHLRILRIENTFETPGRYAADEYKNTINSVLVELKSLLEGKLQLFDDIKNVEKVMLGDISTPEYTALWLVHKRMMEAAEIASKTKIHEHLSKLSDFVSNLNYAFAGNLERHYLERQYNQRRAQRAMDRIVRGEGREAESVIHLSKRPKRDRRAPERLNITSTKSKTYLE